MRLRPEPIEVTIDDPFKHDLLNRKPIADSLTELIRSSPDGLVLALHAPWGQGKTTFLNMWRQSLVNNGARTIYFNAWETDFSEDALVALIGELTDGLSATKGSIDNSALSDSVDSVKRIGAKMIRRVIPSMVKLGTAGIIEASDFTENTLSDLASKIAEEKIEEYEESKKSIVEFRAAIEKVAKNASTKKNEQEPYPLIIIVDELDRCRPNYAIRILECIKHLFSVKGVVFVLAVDRKQLSHAVRSQYGSGMDAVGYLRRFFDIEVSLPEPVGSQFIKSQFSRFGLIQAFNNRENGSHNQGDKNNFIQILPKLFQCMMCSLRDQERAFTLISLALRATPINMYLHPELLSTLIVIRLKDPDLYADFSMGIAKPDVILDRLSAGPSGESFVKSKKGAHLEALLNVCLISDYERGLLLEKYQVAADDPAADSEKRSRAQDILNMISSGAIDSAFESLRYLLGKIDLFTEIER